MILGLFVSPHGSSNCRGPDQTRSLHMKSLLIIIFYPFPVQYCVWTDGLNALLGKDMLSDLTRNDLDTLLSMEIKLRLLDLENIQIPDAPPPIPKEPSNYDFVYDCNWGSHWNLLWNWKYIITGEILKKKKEECEEKKETNFCTLDFGFGEGCRNTCIPPCSLHPFLPHSHLSHCSSKSTLL